VVLLDIGMPVLNGLEAAHQIARDVPRAKIVMLTVHDSDAMIDKVLATGVRGYLFKTDVARDLVDAIKTVHADGTFFTPKVAEILLTNFRDSGTRTHAGASPSGRLTPRQCEIVQLLAEGRSTKEVATLLNISVKTAETHRANLMRRLNCHSVAEVARYALRNQIIEA
jgi:DNA-binding NarL/FixJ family response regulator